MLKPFDSRRGKFQEEILFITGENTPGASAKRGHMKTRVTTNKMAELEAETDEQETYCFTECQKIGKDLLDEVKQSLVRENMEKEESRVKATKYLEETAILHLLEVSLL